MSSFLLSVILLLCPSTVHSKNDLEFNTNTNINMPPAKLIRKRIATPDLIDASNIDEITIVFGRQVLNAFSTTRNMESYTNVPSLSYSYSYSMPYGSSSMSYAYSESMSYYYVEVIDSSSIQNVQIEPPTSSPTIRTINPTSTPSYSPSSSTPTNHPTMDDDDNEGSSDYLTTSSEAPTSSAPTHSPSTSLQQTDNTIITSDNNVTNDTTPPDSSDNASTTSTFDERVPSLGVDDPSSNSPSADTPKTSNTVMYVAPAMGAMVGLFAAGAVTRYRLATSPSTSSLMRYVSVDSPVNDDFGSV